MKTPMFQIFILACLAIVVLADHTEVCDEKMARCYFEPSVKKAETKVLAILIKEPTVHVTVFPCYGEFTW